MPKAKNVTVIPATRNLHTGTPMDAKRRRKVAGYARVSTDSDEQFTSYEAQVDYYTQFIQSNPEWELVEIYTDEGISGLSYKNREGFNRMIADALNGRIDLIVTKSVSRFARNTVDTLTTVRKLKDAGVEVFFQKENIFTLDSKGELLITIISSLAQEESRSISENVTWGQRKSFSDGKVKLPYKQFLGYRKGADGTPEIVPEEAEIILRIYSDFISGKSASAIAKELTREGVPTPAKKAVWHKRTVESILTNEKYKGAALLQKRFHSRYNFGYGILLYMRKMPYFCPLTAHLGDSRGVFSFVIDKSAILCPVGTEVADFVSFKGSIVQGMNKLIIFQKPIDNFQKKSILI